MFVSRHRYARCALTRERVAGSVGYRSSMLIPSKQDSVRRCRPLYLRDPLHRREGRVGLVWSIKEAVKVLSKENRFPNFEQKLGISFGIMLM